MFVRFGVFICSLLRSLFLQVEESVSVFVLGDEVKHVQLLSFVLLNETKQLIITDDFFLSLFLGVVSSIGS